MLTMLVCLCVVQYKFVYVCVYVRASRYVCRLYDDEAVVKNNKIKHFPNKDANERTS